MPRPQALSCDLVGVLAQCPAVRVAENIGQEYLLVTAIRFQQLEIGSRMTAVVLPEAGFHTRLDHGAKCL